MRIQQKSILLVEDGADNQRLLRTMLENDGAAVTVATCGRDAIKSAFDDADQPQFDLILMDIMLPDLDGYATTSYLRLKGYDRPIVALTAESNGGQRNTCIEAGCDEYISKPVDRHTLIEKIVAVLQAASE